MKLFSNIQSIEKESLYKILLFILIFSFPFSAKLPILNLGFMSIYAFRFFIVVAAVLLLYHKDFKLPVKRVSKILLVFVAYLLFYSLISLLWVHDMKSALQHLSFNIWAIGIVLVIFSLLKRTANSLRIVYIAWMSAFLPLAALALMEIHAVVHFDGSFIAQLNDFDFVRMTFFSPFTTLTNPNDYATYIILSLSIFALFFQRKNSLFLLLIVALSLYIIYYTRSNIGRFSLYYIVFLFGMLLFYLTLTKKTIKHLKLIPSRLILSPVFIIFIVFASVVYATFSNKMVVFSNNYPTQNHFVELPKNKEGILRIFQNKKHHSPSMEKKANAFQSTSFNIRKNLAVNGLHLSKQSAFLGIGAGQFIHFHNLGKVPKKLNVNTNPHNFTIELLSQYGLIPVLMWLSFLFMTTFFALSHVLQKSKRQIHQVAVFLLFVIPLYLLVSNSPSSFISFPINWVVITIIAYCYEFLREQSTSNQQQL
jgi:hypothetical protein